jgi:hypothetical protein
MNKAGFPNDGFVYAAIITSCVSGPPTNVVCGSRTAAAPIHPPTRAPPCAPSMQALAEKLFSEAVLKNFDVVDVRMALVRS